MGQVQFLAPGDGDRRTEDASCVLQHEVHFLRCYQFGGNNEISLILAVLIIHYHHELSSLEILYGLFYRIQLYCFHIHYIKKLHIMSTHPQSVPS